MRFRNFKYNKGNQIQPKAHRLQPRISNYLAILVLLITGTAHAITTLPDIDFEEWKVSEWNHVTLLSNAGKRDSQTIGESVTKFIANISEVLPYPTRGDRWPLRIVVCKDAKTFRQLAPDAPKFQNNASGIFTQGLGYDTIVILANAPRSRIKSIVFHELVHREMRSQGEIPLWLDEGLAEVFSSFRFNKTNMEFGISDSNHRRWIQRSGLTPFSRLFHVTFGSPEYNDTQLANRFYATSWIFTHYGLFAENGTHRETFLSFVEAARTHIVTESLFREHFSIGYNEMAQRLTSYARQFRFPKGKLDNAQTTPRSTITWNPSDPRKTKLILAGATTLSGRYESSQALLDSIPSPSTSHASASDTAIEQATLAYYLQDVEAAHEYATNAYLDGDRSPTTLLLHSENLLQIHHGQRVRYDLVIPLKDVNQALRGINEILELSPRNPLACRLYVLAWLRTNAEPSTAQYQKLMNNARTLADDSEIAFLTADLLIFHRQFNKARSVLESFRDHTYNRAARDEAVNRLKALP